MQKALKDTKKHPGQFLTFLCIFQYGDTPLHTAARYGHAGVARILLSAASNPNLQNKVRNIFIITIYNVSGARVWCKITTWNIWTKNKNWHLVKSPYEILRHFYKKNFEKYLIKYENLLFQLFSGHVNKQSLLVLQFSSVQVHIWAKTWSIVQDWQALTS